MPKPIKFSYEKKAPFRDASFFIIICEGSNREPEYFRVFDGISPRVKVVPVECTAGKSAPRNLIAPALAKQEALGATLPDDRLWFVIDTDKWQAQIHELRDECNKHPHWQVAQSNPCFEVWLYMHAFAKLPELAGIAYCNSWKPHLPKVIKGGFDTTYHPAHIETAIANAKAIFGKQGYTPNVGSTQLWRLGKNCCHL